MLKDFFYLFTVESNKTSQWPEIEMLTMCSSQNEPSLQLLSIEHATFTMEEKVLKYISTSTSTYTSTVEILSYKCSQKKNS